MYLKLDKYNSKRSTNRMQVLPIELQSAKRIVPSCEITSTLNEYEQYIKEKDSSNKYRLFFNIKPYCTNVLFNILTELVVNEGSDDCFVIDNGISDKEWYKKFNDSITNIRSEFIRDTAFSHPELGNVVYHCGYDIFNNHLLRAKEFSLINIADTDGESSEIDGDFNTIRDKQRDNSGNLISKASYKLGDSGTKLESGSTDLHVYSYDSIMSFNESLSVNLTEKNAWYGFYNKANMKNNNVRIGNDRYISVNKVMNNNKAGEFIDMYPDRSLYSFIPKYNKHRNRNEKNWDYCLTYPYRNEYAHELVSYIGEGITINGLRTRIVTVKDELDNITDTDYVTFKTDVFNGYETDDNIGMAIVYNDGTIFVVDNRITVSGVGEDGYTFTVLYDDINTVSFDEIKEIRTYKYKNGSRCKYYIRIFKRIPNFNNTDVYNDGVVEEEEIEKYCERDFGSTNSKLSFSRTIYNDQCAQIVFNEDIDLTGIRNNLGRYIDTIYLTIVKTCIGNDEWYGGNTTADTIEFSHCFSKVTAGIDGDVDMDDYNVHKLHNCSDSTIKPLGDEITVKGDKNLGKGEFYGDIVEFSEYELNEYILDNVYFRFNTYQREMDMGDDGGFYIDSITYDDYDFKDFEVKENLYGEDKDINKNKEGYYYKPHYAIAIRDYSNVIKQGEHTKMIVESIVNGDGKTIIKTSINYMLAKGYFVYVYCKNDGSYKSYRVTDVDGANYCSITVTGFTATEGYEYVFFKGNPSKPNNAYELSDGTGRYIWKDVKSEREVDGGDRTFDSMFTNGRHYRNETVNFYLFRQDPYGNYGLNEINSDDCKLYKKRLLSNGLHKDIDKYDYIEEDGGTIEC